MSREMGVTEEQLRDLPVYRDSAHFDERERLAIDLAVAMAGTPVDVPSELTADLRRYLTEGELVELAAAIAWENWRARFNRVFGVRPAGFMAEGAFCALPEHHADRA